MPECWEGGSLQEDGSLGGRQRRRVQAILPTLVLDSQEGKRWVATRQTDTQTHRHHPVCPVKLCDSTIMPFVSEGAWGGGELNTPSSSFRSQRDKARPGAFSGGEIGLT